MCVDFVHNKILMEETKMKFCFPNARILAPSLTFSTLIEGNKSCFFLGKKDTNTSQDQYLLNQQSNVSFYVKWIFIIKIICYLSITD